MQRGARRLCVLALGALATSTVGTVTYPNRTVTDAATRRVLVIQPGIALSKDVDQPVLLAGDTATYTCVASNTGDVGLNVLGPTDDNCTPLEVKNTGNVPLSGVTARITDNTCPGVTYVSGDTNGNGLLDTPTSIYGNPLDESWTFTCTTTVATTTTNRVDVTGTPTDPDGNRLCAAPPSTPTALVLAVPCDATSSATAIVTVTPLGTVVIVKRTTAVTNQTFSFQLGTETITLGRDGTHTVNGVRPGTYTVTESTKTGWLLASLTCVDATGDSVATVATRTASIVVAPGETVTCTFTNQATGTLPATGNSDSRAALDLGIGLVGAGLALLVGSRRRRIAPVG